jgi:glycosyltransferase involved in cell wall biosynthesis
VKRLKVCYILAKTEGGVWAFEQLRELRDNYNCDVSIILSGTQGTLVDRFKKEGIPVYQADFEFTRSSDIFSLPLKILKLVKLLRKKKFDILQTHLFNSMVIGRIAGWLADAPVRVSMIAGPFHLEAKTPRWVDKITSWMDTLILPSCEYTRQLYLQMGVPEHKLELVYYGPDIRRFDYASTQLAGLREQFGWPQNTPLIGKVAYFYPKLTASRWAPEFLHGKALKGHEYLIKSAPTVLREFPNAKFLLIGNGWGAKGDQLMEEMQDLVAELNLQESVIFTGLRINIPEIYRDLDISVQSSLSENLGGTIEALLMECPTVVTRVGGLVDTVIDGKTGVQVNPADERDLARGILQLLRNPQEARLLGKAGRNYMLEKFTLDTTTHKLHSLYQINFKPSKPSYRLFKTVIRGIALGVFSFLVILRFFLADKNFFRRQHSKTRHSADSR